jgi:hypothetical protein
MAITLVVYSVFPRILFYKLIRYSSSIHSLGVLPRIQVRILLDEGTVRTRVTRLQGAELSDMCRHSQLPTM